LSPEPSPGSTRLEVISNPRRTALPSRLAPGTARESRPTPRLGNHFLVSAQQKVEGPAAAVVLTAAAAMSEHLFAIAADVLQGISENRQVCKSGVVVDGGRHRQDNSSVARQPGRVEAQGAEGIAGDVADDVGGTGDVGGTA